MKIGQQIAEAQNVFAFLNQQIAMAAHTEMLYKGGSWADCFRNNVDSTVRECLLDPAFARAYGDIRLTAKEHAPGLQRFMAVLTVDLLRRGQHPADMDLANDDVWFAYLDSVIDAQTKGTGPLAGMPEVLNKRF